MTLESLPQSDNTQEILRGQEVIRRRMVAEHKKSAVALDEELRDEGPEHRTEQELEELFCRREVFTLGNLELHMTGFPHIAASVPILRKHFEQQVASTDFTVLEQGIEIDDPEVARSQIAITNPDAYAFLEVERIARDYNKKVILTDPGYNYDGTSKAKYRQQLERLDRRVATGVTAASATAAVAGGGYVAAHVAKPLFTKELSRRDFLKTSAAMGTAVAGLEVRATQAAHGNSTFAPDKRALVYNLTDYRDVVIAEGIDKLSQSLAKKMKAALIFGDGHIDGIKYYLSNPRIRKIKLGAYKPYVSSSLAELSVNKFVLDDEVTESNARKQNFGQWHCTSKLRIV